METVEGVVVVGGGSVGLLTAFKLGKAGIRVLVLEAGSGVAPAQHAVAFTPPALAALDRFGLLDDVRKRAVMSPDLAYRHADGREIARLQWDALAQDTHYPYLLLLGQRNLSALIRERLRGMANVEIRWNQRVEDIEQDADYVTLHTASPGGEARLRSAWVVGADGARSTVREKLGLKFGGSQWPERMVALDVFYDFALHGFSRANFIHDPADWAYVVQLDKSGLWRVCFEEDPSLSDEQVRQRLPERLKKLLPGAPTPDQYRVDDVEAYRVQQRCVSEFRRGRVVLAGDAAHTSNPMGGLGLSGAVLEAEQLADALIAVANDEAAIGALDQFAARRRNTFLELTSANASAYFTAMKESGPIQRSRDLTMLEKAGNDRSLMRRILLDFDKLNGQRSRSITAWGRRVTGSSRWFAQRTVRATSRSALALVSVVKHRLAGARSV